MNITYFSGILQKLSNVPICVSIFSSLEIIETTIKILID